MRKQLLIPQTALGLTLIALTAVATGPARADDMSDCTEVEQLNDEASIALQEAQSNIAAKQEALAAATANVAQAQAAFIQCQKEAGGAGSNGSSADLCPGPSQALMRAVIAEDDAKISVERSGSINYYYAYYTQTQNALAACRQRVASKSKPVPPPSIQPESTPPVPANLDPPTLPPILFTPPSPPLQLPLLPPPVIQVNPPQSAGLMCHYQNGSQTWSVTVTGTQCPVINGVPASGSAPVDPPRQDVYIPQRLRSASIPIYPPRIYTPPVQTYTPPSHGGSNWKHQRTFNRHINIVSRSHGGGGSRHVNIYRHTSFRSHGGGGGGFRRGSFGGHGGRHR